MRWILAVLCFALAAQAADSVSFTQAAFSRETMAHSGWQPWSHNPTTAPRAHVDPAISADNEAGSLALDAAGNPAVYGGWTRPLTGLQPGHWYHFAASYRSEAVPAENWQVVARIDWKKADGKRTDQPDYAAWARRNGEWTRVEATVQAPAEAASATLQLYMVHAASGKVWWDNIEFREVPAPAPLPVKIATVNLRPRNMASKTASLEEFARLVRAQVPQDTDLILLPEGVTVVGTRSSYVEVAAKVPGPDTEFLGQLAREKNAWLAAGVYEREGDIVYNTAVLINRQGQLAGKYRKVYLPREELEGGITPGDAYPVFETDFGRVGMMICYDVFFPDPARALAVQGADIVLMPIWGGPERLAVARALENRVFLVASGYDHPTYIMDPDGERIASARENGSVAVATVDLRKRHREQWLGEMRTRRLREIRTDVPMPEPGLLSGTRAAP